MRTNYNKQNKQKYPLRGKIYPQHEDKAEVRLALVSEKIKVPQENTDPIKSSQDQYKREEDGWNNDTREVKCVQDALNRGRLAYHVTKTIIGVTNKKPESSKQGALQGYVKKKEPTIKVKPENALENALKNALENASKNASTLKNELDALKNQYNGLNASYKNALSKIDLLAAENAKLKEEIGEQNKKIETQKKQFAKLAETTIDFQKYYASPSKKPASPTSANLVALQSTTAKSEGYSALTNNKILEPGTTPSYTTAKKLSKNLSEISISSSTGSEL